MTGLVWFVVLFVMPLVLLVALRKDEERGRKIILRLLDKHKEMSGLQIIDASDGFFGTSDVYHLLRKMEREGLLLSRLDHTDLEIRGGHPRTLYRRSGKRAKRKWWSFVPLPV